MNRRSYCVVQILAIIAGDWPCTDLADFVETESLESATVLSRTVRRTVSQAGLCLVVKVTPAFDSAGC